MNKYKVITEVEINGSLQFVGTEVELSAEDAASFVEAGQLEIVSESAPVAEEATASEPVETVTSEPTTSDVETPLEEATV
jgi:hypothetical protein